MGISYITTAYMATVAYYLKQTEMADIHTQYLKEDHFQDEDEEELNIEPQKNFAKERDSPDQQLEAAIMEEVLKLEKIEDTISADLQAKLASLLSKIGDQTEEEIVRLRMNELALNKILVYTHGKSQFRLVAAHHHIGKAYLDYKCYEQAIDHLTLALKKNSKINELRESKLYHSFLLTTLSKCYYQIASYEDALEVLARALDIQNVSYKELGQPDKCSVQTLRLIACCNLKLKHYKKAHEFIDKAQLFCVGAFGQKSTEVAKLKIDSAKIFFEQKNYESAIRQLDLAVEMLIELNYGNKLELVDLEDLLASYYEKNGQADKQIETLFAKLEIFLEIYDQSHKNSLKLKRSIASVLIKNHKHKEAVAILDQILEAQQKVYGPSSLHVGKTLKMLGLVFISSEQEANSAEHYLKRAQKIFQDQGNAKLVKEIKGKLNAVKQARQKRINGLISQQ